MRIAHLSFCTVPRNTPLLARGELVTHPARGSASSACRHAGFQSDDTLLRPLNLTADFSALTFKGSLLSRQAPAALVDGSAKRFSMYAIASASADATVICVATILRAACRMTAFRSVDCFAIRPTPLESLQGGQAKLCQHAFDHLVVEPAVSDKLLHGRLDDRALVCVELAVSLAQIIKTLQCVAFLRAQLLRGALRHLRMKLRKVVGDVGNDLARAEIDASAHAVEAKGAGSVAQLTTSDERPMRPEHSVLPYLHLAACAAALPIDVPDLKVHAHGPLVRDLPKASFPGVAIGLRPGVSRRESFPYDRGSEMACHVELAKRLKLDIWLADPYAPWQRGSNENTTA